MLNDPDEDDWTLTVNGPRYSIDSTGATLTYSNATTLLSMVCALLPHDEFTPHPAPSYETQQIGGVGGTWFSTVTADHGHDGRGTDDRGCGNAVEAVG